MRSPPRRPGDGCSVYPLISGRTSLGAHFTIESDHRDRRQAHKDEGHKILISLPVSKRAGYGLAIGRMLRSRALHVCVRWVHITPAWNVRISHSVRHDGSSSIADRRDRAMHTHTQRNGAFCTSVEKLVKLLTYSHIATRHNKRLVNKRLRTGNEPPVAQTQSAVQSQGAR